MVPEGLLPTLTLALVLATQRMARRNVLIRYLPSVETLGSTTVICTDKTGTLTQNRMTVQENHLGETLHSPASLEHQPQLVRHYEPFFLGARLCHDLREGTLDKKTRFLGDSMEIASVEMAQHVLVTGADYQRVDEIPFDAQRMRLSILYATPEGPTVFCKGAPEAVLGVCRDALTDGDVLPLSAELRAKIVQAQEAMAQRGLRVLAFAFKKLGASDDRARLEQDLVFTGLVGFEDPPRPEAPDALRRCQTAGIKVIMITGEDLQRLSSTQLQLALDAPDTLFARVVADQKLRIVQALQSKRIAASFSLTFSRTMFPS